MALVLRISCLMLSLFRPRRYHIALSLSPACRLKKEAKENKKKEAKEAMQKPPKAKESNEAPGQEGTEAEGTQVDGEGNPLPQPVPNDPLNPLNAAYDMRAYALLRKLRLDEEHQISQDRAALFH